MVVPAPAVMPSGIQPDGRSILAGNGLAAAAGPAAIANANASVPRNVRERRIMVGLRCEWVSGATWGIAADTGGAHWGVVVQGTSVRPDRFFTGSVGFESD